MEQLAGVFFSEGLVLMDMAILSAASFSYRFKPCCHHHYASAVLIVAG
jgi:hypothetical protein